MVWEADRRNNRLSPTRLPVKNEDILQASRYSIWYNKSRQGGPTNEKRSANGGL